MKNRRGWKSTLFSPVSMKALRLTNYAAAFLIMVFAIVLAGLLSQLEVLLTGLAGAFRPDAEVILKAFSIMKVLIPCTLAPIAVFVLLSEKGHRRQMRCEMVALLDQIKSLNEGDYTRKRQMRKDDELKPVMWALHELGDQLDQSNTRAPLVAAAEERQDRTA